MPGIAARAVAQQTGFQPEPEAELPRHPAEINHAPAHAVVDKVDAPAPSAAFLERFEGYGEEIDYDKYDFDGKPPELLDAPDPRAGFVNRWIAVTTGNTDDVANLTQRLQEGYRPRDPATCANWTPPTIKDGQWAGTIFMRGMVLMERPLKLHKRAAALTRERTKGQMSAVRHNLLAVHNQDGPMGRPVMEESTRVTRRPSVQPADDDD